MAVAKRKAGLVCTFYSYKGGVGRSMALANVAVLLSRLGQKVLVIDWDLEAPGLEQYFGPKYRTWRKSTPGLVDLIGSYGSKPPMDWRECILSATVPKGEAVHIIHAGLDDEQYSERLRALNWTSLFDQGLGRDLETMRSEWKREYDYVFVDSRTGITDIGGICSILLPDYLISFFTTNEQSVLGVKDAMTRARAAQSNLPLDRQRLIIIPIAARDESTTEYKRAAEWRKRFAIELSGFYDDWIHKDETAESVLDYLKIPYVAYWSFGEQLPVLAEDASNPKTLAYSYALIARLIHSRLDWSEVREGRETTEQQAQRDADVQARLAEAAKARTEALSQQQAESVKVLEERKAALLRRFEYLVQTARSGLRYNLVVATTVPILALAAGLSFYLWAHSSAFFGSYALLTGLGTFAYAILALAGWCFVRFLRHQRTYNSLQREYAAYTIAHGIYSDLGSEASLRTFGDRIEKIAEDSSSPSQPSIELPAPPGRDFPAMPLPPPRDIASSSTVATSLPRPLPKVDELSSIDVLLAYPQEGIARDWALEFVPLFSRWLSELLGRGATIFDASSGQDLKSFHKATSISHTAVMILSGRTREMESATDLALVLENFPSGRLFPLRLGPAPRETGPNSALAGLQWTDFSDLAYVGEGFAKSERYIEFQDRVRALAGRVAEAIEQESMLRSPAPIA